MAKHQHGKKYRAAMEKFDRTKRYPLKDACEILVKSSYVKFDETVDLAIRLGVDPKQADQMVRGTVVLPHGTGKTVRICVFAKGEKVNEAKEAGAEHYGAEDLIEKVQKGFMDFDTVISTPDMMSQVGKLGKVLGPKGLMPNPKVGTVTFDVAKAVKEAKAGKVEFRVDKSGIIHVPVAKVSFGAEKVKDNALAMLEAIQKHKPATAKGTYMRSIGISSSMGIGVKIDALDLKNYIA